MHAAEGSAVAAAGQDLLAVEGALLRPHAGLPQLLQARHVENVGDGRVPLQGEMGFDLIIPHFHATTMAPIVVSLSDAEPGMTATVERLDELIDGDVPFSAEDVRD